MWFNTPVNFVLKLKDASNDKEGVTLKITFRHTAVGFSLSALAATSSLAQPAGPFPKEQLQVLAAAFGEVKHSLVEKPDDHALIVAAVKGLLRGADPESG